MITNSHWAFSQPKYLFAALLAAVVSLAAVQPVVASEPPIGPEQSELRGAIYDSSGLPLIGALIAVAMNGEEGGPSALVVSNSRGRFVVTQLPPGLYTVMARSYGFVSAIHLAVAIPRPEPMRLQLRSERQVVSLLSADATPDLGWAFRRRDVLRQTERGGLGFDEPSAADFLAQPDEARIWDNLGGELNLWTVAPIPGIADDGRSATDFSLGSYDTGSRNWMMRGQLADGGVVRARSEMSRVLSDAHALRIGVGFAGKDLAGVDVNEERRRMWVGSLSAEDYWRLGEAVQVGYGIRFEHYNYLQETGLVSPRVQVAFAPVESVKLTTGVSYDAEAPGLAELRFQVDPLAVRYMDVLATENIDAERTLRYELGVERSTETTEVRARAYYDQVSDELVGVYLANANGTSDYFVRNIGDSVTQGIEVDVRQTILDWGAGFASYAYGRRAGGSLPAELGAGHGLLGDVGFDSDAAAVDVVHELAAGVETVVGGYDTRLRAMYRWKSGVPVVRNGNVEDVYERLDLRVRQPLPFRALASDWSALVQVQNVLGRSYDGVFDFRLGDAPVLSRLIAGGLAVRF